MLCVGRCWIRKRTEPTAPIWFRALKTGRNSLRRCDLLLRQHKTLSMRTWMAILVITLPASFLLENQEMAVSLTTARRMTESGRVGFPLTNRSEERRVGKE